MKALSEASEMKESKDYILFSMWFYVQYKTWVGQSYARTFSSSKYDLNTDFHIATNVLKNKTQMILSTLFPLTL